MSVTHSRHLCRKCKKAGSSALTAADKLREPGRRLRPLEFVTLRGNPFESTQHNIHEYYIGVNYNAGIADTIRNNRHNQKEDCYSYCITKHCKNILLTLFFGNEITS